MTSSCGTTINGDNTENTSEIPNCNVIPETPIPELQVFPQPDNDVTESAPKPKLAGESQSDLQPTENTISRPHSSVDLRLPARGSERRSSFTLSPEQLWLEPDGFRGGENYGFEMAKWAQEQKMQNR